MPKKPIMDPRPTEDRDRFNSNDKKQTREPNRLEAEKTHNKGKKGQTELQAQQLWNLLEQIRPALKKNDTNMKQTTDT